MAQHPQLRTVTVTVDLDGVTIDGLAHDLTGTASFRCNLDHGVAELGAASVVATRDDHEQRTIERDELLTVLDDELMWRLQTNALAQLDDEQPAPRRPSAEVASA